MALLKKWKQEKEDQSESPIAKLTGSEMNFQCPMLCEGDKTYDKEGRCPICKMDLQPVKSELYF